MKQRRLAGGEGTSRRLDSVTRGMADSAKEGEHERRDVRGPAPPSGDYPPTSGAVHPTVRLYF
jgi:hypothetical protein